MDDSRVRQASDLLSAILSPAVGEKAAAWARLGGFWARTVGETLAAHSRIADLRNGTAFVEADHPGWIQLLQLKQDSSLKAIRAAYPELGISALAFRLGRDSSPPGTTRTRFATPEAQVAAALAGSSNFQDEPPESAGHDGKPAASAKDTIAAVEDPAFRGLLESVAGTLEKASRGSRGDRGPVT